MPLSALLEALTRYLHSKDFHDRARSPEHPNALTRTRKLPLPTLIAVMLTGLRKSVQAELDTFLEHLQEQGQRVHYVTEQALVQARSKLPRCAGSTQRPFSSPCSRCCYLAKP